MAKLTTTDGRWFPVIGFTGLAGSGKTTAAGFFESRGFVRLSFAEPLKRMLRVLCDVDQKDSAPNVLGGKTVRQALQSLGTDWARRELGDGVWVRHMAERVEEWGKDAVAHSIWGVVIDDVRFDNEAQMVREFGGMVVEIERNGLTRMEHASEAGVHRVFIDRRIPNNGKVEELESAVLAAVGWDLFTRCQAPAVA